MASTDVLNAVQRLRGVTIRTPMLTSPAADADLGRQVWVKAENLQRTGSFKLRGAYNAVACLEQTQRGPGVIAASSGNHAQALALAAHLHQVPATVVIPADAPAAKKEAIDALGARSISYDRHRQRRDAIVHRIARRDGLAIVPSANDHAVIAGAGTVGWEMLQEVHDLAAILVPVGGGGLAAGVALAASGQRVKVIGVEPDVADDTLRSLSAGHLCPIPPPKTVADGLGHTEPAALPFEINRRLLADVITVSEQAIGEAMAYLWRYYRSAAEPSGAVAFAGLLQAADRLPDGPVGVVLSGGNVDWPAYRSLLDIAWDRAEGESSAAATPVLR
ncbi:threonine/serine dehydratase [Streptomyces scabiei]|uniref:threonine/serine dehydratase n=1 Tax=Streptomyces scabiei TaxID=1930 RepID=UPI0029C0685D|nr:threonine/serine dehydratase [Streptomyces scabiei]